MNFWIVELTDLYIFEAIPVIDSTYEKLESPSVFGSYGCINQFHVGLRARFRQSRGPLLLAANVLGDPSVLPAVVTGTFLSLFLLSFQLGPLWS